jgi:hypothetical protein
MNTLLDVSELSAVFSLRLPFMKRILGLALPLSIFFGFYGNALGSEAVSVDEIHLD